MKIRIYTIFCLFVFITFVSMGCSSSGGDGDDDDDNDDFSSAWTSTDVDTSGNVGIDPAIALDSSGNPHICYYDQTNEDLKYASLSDGSWVTETVISTGDVGEECGIAVDSSDNPHVSSNNGDTTNALRYATKSGGSWDIETFEQPENYHVTSTSIALDSDGYPHIVYNISSNDDVEDEDDDFYRVRYTYWDGSDWQVENIATNGEDVFLGIDSNDNSHVSLRRENIDEESDVTRLSYAKRTAGTWNVTTIDSDTSAGGDTGLAVDSSNNPHIVYRDYGNSAVRYAYHDGTSWSTQVVAADGGDNEGTKIAIDSNGNPHIVYASDDTERLYYTVLSDGSWSSEIIDRMGNSAIAIDSSDIPHVARTRTWGDDSEYGENAEYLKYSVRE